MMGVKVAGPMKCGVQTLRVRSNEDCVYAFLLQKAIERKTVSVFIVSVSALRNRVSDSNDLYRCWMR